MTRPPQTAPSLPAHLRDGQLLPPAIVRAGHTAGVKQRPARARDEAEHIRLGDPGPCPPDGATVFIVLDESASVASGGGNDPLSRRHEETALAIWHVAAACQCGRDRAALVPFDMNSAGHVAPQPFTARGLRRLDRGLHRLSGGCGLSSDLGPALDRVEAYAGRQCENNAVVVFSDFLLTDANPSNILSRLRTLPGYVHAVVLGAAPPRVLVAAPDVTVTHLTPSSPPGSAARAVFDGLTHFRTILESRAGQASPRCTKPSTGRSNSHDHT
ncbi:hypothetical protein ORI20_30825 [Mycobacterium sp. CVI_P3]|uniref:VWFA domain-containing protein n=1 Tax=Mycobacterium pinniadriaticum TaxID=2994102 RepID=A0ABT3SNH3_9MYCO|nr:VWA domain-containing protein [Mycobacterium pinniadriaticum]MCX2934667.1 hypothetical protein [Mycobacterium pinniadriaticum]MCX2941089.1 hypothetical protein [Mycobacterium pinniadriaticum]